MDGIEERRTTRKEAIKDARKIRKKDNREERYREEMVRKKEGR